MKTLRTSHFLVIFLIILLITSACKSNSVTSTNNDNVTIEDRMMAGGEFNSHIPLDFAKVKNKMADKAMIMTSNKACAISISPVDAWHEEKRDEMGDIFDEVISDNSYYNSLAVESLKSNGIPTENATREKQYIQFVKSNKSIYTIDLNLMKDAWGLILFNGNDNPVFWNATDIEPEIKEIFRK